MNTAVADSWGFPAPCPDNCDCKCFECGNPTCACALPSGYCDNFPAGFEIDYVRVYQAKDESKHVLGCSPVDRPTASFIEGHASRYMDEGQKTPLQHVQRGGGDCSGDIDCGGEKKGRCSSSHSSCVCNDDWTGPNCLAHAAFYDYDTSAPIKHFSCKSPPMATRRIHTSCSTRPSHPFLFLSSVSRVMVPTSLIYVIGLLIAGFILSLTISIRVKGKQATYQKLGSVGQNDNSTQSGASYQNPASAQYAIPPTQKVVTYCVIDGRLVDS